VSALLVQPIKDGAWRGEAKRDRGRQREVRRGQERSHGKGGQDQPLRTSLSALPIRLRSPPSALTEAASPSTGPFSGPCSVWSWLCRTCWYSSAKALTASASDSFGIVG
jgi:hypothetical protein